MSEQKLREAVEVFSEALGKRWVVVTEDPIFGTLRLSIRTSGLTSEQAVEEFRKDGRQRGEMEVPILGTVEIDVALTGNVEPLDK